MCHICVTHWSHCSHVSQPPGPLKSLDSRKQAQKAAQQMPPPPPPPPVPATAATTLVKDREISGKGGKCLKGTTERAEMGRKPIRKPIRKPYRVSMMRLFLSQLAEKKLAWEKARPFNTATVLKKVFSIVQFDMMQQTSLHRLCDVWRCCSHGTPKNISRPKALQ